MYSCSLFGHRYIDTKEDLYQPLFNIMENLIIQKNVSIFNFGTKSEFYDICYDVFMLLQKKYKHIKSECYLCNSECECLKNESSKYQNILDKISKLNIRLKEFDKINNLSSSNMSGKWAYIKRNQEMIKNSKVCIFYLNQDYEPPLKSLYGGKILFGTKSGTPIAYNYAFKLRKSIIVLNNYLN